MTAEPAAAADRLGWRVTWLGHATVLIDVAGTSLLTDPILRRRVAFLRSSAPLVDHSRLDGCRAVLISHLHHDHCDVGSLRMLPGDRELLVPAGRSGFFRRRGLGDVTALAPGDVHRVGAVTVTATAADHDGRRLPLGPHRPAAGFVVAGGGVRIYFAGDTDLFEEMADLRPVDVALLPVAGWGRTLGPGHLDPVRAAEAARRLRAAVAVPIHWGSLRPLWHRTPWPSQTVAIATAFADEVRRRGLPTTVAVLAPGGSLSAPLGAGR